MGGGARIRWSGLARIAGIGLGGLGTLVAVGALARAPEQPRLAADIGLRRLAPPPPSPRRAEAARAHVKRAAKELARVAASGSRHARELAARRERERAEPAAQRRRVDEPPPRREQPTPAPPAAPASSPPAPAYTPAPAPAPPPAAASPPGEFGFEH